MSLARMRQRAEAAKDALDRIDWYRRCLEDAVDGRPVRDLPEAKGGYDSAFAALAAALATLDGDPE